MDEDLLYQAIDKMEKDSFFMILQIYKNRNVSNFIREILRERIGIHKVVFYRLKEMRILFNRQARIQAKFKPPRINDLMTVLKG